MRSELNGAVCCPWCLGLRLWVWDKGMPGKVAISCSNPNCGATGPLAADLVTAVALWNEPPRLYHRPSPLLKIDPRFEIAMEEADEADRAQEARATGRHGGT